MKHPYPNHVCDNNDGECICKCYGQGRAEMKLELLQRFNDYEVPLAMTAEEVREIIIQYSIINNK